jgi:hypothetical protein
MRSALAKLVVLLVAVVAALLLVTRNSRFGWFLVGLMVGLYAAMVIAVITIRTYNFTSGALAEASTSEILRKQRGWYVIDNVPFERFDVDHVAIAPGGVLSVETKYIGSGAEDWLDQRIEAAARQARDASEKARKLIAHQLKRELPVSALVVLWGAGVSDAFYEVVRVNDVPVVHGDHARSHLDQWNVGKLSRRDAREIGRDIEIWVERRDQHDDAVGRA